MTQAETGAAGTGRRTDETPALRFLCDEMLTQLGRWLRAAGYDTIIAGHGTDDRALVARAVIDRRILLTRDRKLLEIRDAARCVDLLGEGGIRAWVAAVTPRFEIDWLARPFSRCLVCNTPLQPAPPLARGRLPPGVLAEVQEINYCRQCDKLYWPGGHVRRMMETLERWRAGRFA